MATELIILQAPFSRQPSVLTANALYHKAISRLDWAYREQFITWTSYILMLIRLDDGYLGDVTNEQAIVACQEAIDTIDRITGQEKHHVDLID